MMIVLSCQAKNIQISTVFLCCAHVMKRGAANQKRKWGVSGG